MQANRRDNALPISLFAPFTLNCNCQNSIKTGKFKTPVEVPDARSPPEQKPGVCCSLINHHKVDRHYRINGLININCVFDLNGLFLEHSGVPECR
jgi:hypothetical protein